MLCYKSSPERLTPISIQSALLQYLHKIETIRFFPIDLTVPDETCFQLVHVDVTLILQCESADAVTHWMTAIEEAVQSIPGNLLTNSGSE